MLCLLFVPEEEEMYLLETFFFFFFLSFFVFCDKILCSFSVLWNNVAVFQFNVSLPHCNGKFYLGPLVLVNPPFFFFFFFFFFLLSRIYFSPTLSWYTLLLSLEYTLRYARAHLCTQIAQLLVKYVFLHFLITFLQVVL